MIEILKAIIDHLRKGEALMIKLGYTLASPDGVFEDQSFNLNSVKYPRIHIGINVDNPMHAQQVLKMAGKSKTVFYFDIHIFSNTSTSLESGEIEEIVRERMESVKISYSGVIFSGQAQKESLVQAPQKDPETGIIHTIARYKVIARIE
mgnify:CR=1 FL=1